MQRCCCGEACEFGGAQPPQRASTSRSSQERTSLGDLVSPLVSKHLFNLEVERILLSQHLGPAELHLVPEPISQQLQSHLWRGVRHTLQPRKTWTSEVSSVLRVVDTLWEGPP